MVLRFGQLRIPSSSPGPRSGSPGSWSVPSTIDKLAEVALGLAELERVIDDLIRSSMPLGRPSTHNDPDSPQRRGMGHGLMGGSCTSLTLGDRLPSLTEQLLLEEIVSPPAR